MEKVFKGEVYEIDQVYKEVMAIKDAVPVMKDQRVIEEINLCLSFEKKHEDMNQQELLKEVYYCFEVRNFTRCDSAIK